MGGRQPCHRDRPPMTVVVCGHVAQATAVRRTPGVPLTWIANSAELEQIGTRAAGTQARPWPATDAVAVEIEPAWLDSRHAILAAAAAVRAVHIDLRAGVVRDGELRDPRLAAAAGLRAVLVRSCAAARGSRRPAPAGWPCRNPAWGLWEVERAGSPPRRGIWRRLFGRGSGGRRGGLVVLDASTHSVAVLQRWIDWATRGVASGSVVGVTLPDLATTLDAPGDARVRASDHVEALERGSVLRAA